jgi:hypothetical protein
MRDVMDVDEEFKKLDEAEVKTLEENEELRSLLSSVKSSSKSIRLGNKDIRIKAYMKKQLRSKFIKVSRKLGEIDGVEDVEAIEQQFYPLVAAMCIDAPYNNSKTWQYIDDQEGCIQDVTMRIIAEVNNTDVKIKSFR